jgi:hypothetical protein
MVEKGPEPPKDGLSCIGKMRAMTDGMMNSTYRKALRWFR